MNSSNTIAIAIAVAIAIAIGKWEGVNKIMDAVAVHWEW